MRTNQLSETNWIGMYVMLLKQFIKAARLFNIELINKKSIYKLALPGIRTLLAMIGE